MQQVTVSTGRELFSQREYARRRGVSRMRISRALAAGTIELVEGKIDPVLADRAFGFGSTELLSMRAYARRRGVSHPSISKAVKTGRIPLVEGKIDPKLADEALAQNTDPSKPGRWVTGRPGQRAAEPLTLPLEPPGGNGDGTTYAGARAEREHAQAKLAQLQLERQQGTLVDAAAVKGSGFSEGRRARDLLLTLPARLAPLLATLDDEQAIETIIEEEIEQLCEEIGENRETES